MKRLLCFACTLCMFTNLLLAQNWSLTGNAGTTPGTNFLGTTDAKALMFKTNNQQSGYIDFGSAKANTAFGFQTIRLNTGNINTAVGYKASFSNTTGSFNTSLGGYALFFNTTGYSNVALGGGALYKNTTQHNIVAVGDSALYNNGAGATFAFQASGNSAFGSKSLYSNTKGYNNTATGFQSLYLNTTGYENTANGYQALYTISTGGDNTATGYLALYATTGGFYNTANGSQALKSNTMGGNNTASGYQAMFSNTTGGDNTATGVGALYFNTTGYYNTAFGKYALQRNTTGYYNTATGPNALFFNTTGHDNTANGYYALNHNTTGEFNTGIGKEALYQNTSGLSNAAFGVAAMYANTTGSYNTVTGNNALTNNINGSYNTVNGNEAMVFNSSGSFNTAVGTSALYNNTGSNYNCAFGYLAMSFAIPGYNNTAVGAFCGLATDFDGLFNTIAVGNSTYVTASNQARFGNSSTTSIGGYANWTNISDGRVKKNIKSNVPGLSFINKLNPVTYNLDLDAAEKITKTGVKKDNDGKVIAPAQTDIEARNAKQRILYTGFVAQDVEKAAKDLGYDFSGVDAAKNDRDLYGLRYAEFVVPLVKAVQELSKMNDTKDEEIADLKTRLERLEAMMNTSAATKNTPAVTGASLDKNVPNPLTNITTIYYTLPQQYGTAKLVVTDKSGKTMKVVTVTGNGSGNITLNAQGFASGTYQYALYVDGRFVASKQMEVIK